MRAMSSALGLGASGLIRWLALGPNKRRRLPARFARDSLLFGLRQRFACLRVRSVHLPSAVLR
jgi:hypothetical protein